MSAELTARPWLTGRSYAYLGWVLDKANRGELLGDAFPALYVLGAMLGGEVELGNVVLNAQMAAGLDAQLRAYPVPTLDPDWLQHIGNLDIPDVTAHPKTGEPLGNGSGNTIFRLREGIERFLLSDVNNPAASAQAQSAIWVMFDQSAPKGEGIQANHQPGGSNVLYMDGHVAYVAYAHGPFDPQLSAWLDGQAKPPVSPSIARTVGALGAAR